jgi:hypothetical protein
VKGARPGFAPGGILDQGGPEVFEPQGRVLQCVQNRSSLGSSESEDRRAVDQRQVQATGDGGWHNFSEPPQETLVDRDAADQHVLFLLAAVAPVVCPVT